MRTPSHWGAVGIWNVTTIRPFCFEETTACQTKVSFVISYSEFCRQVRLLPAHNHPLFLWELDKIKHLQNQSCHPLIYKDTLTWLRLDDCNSFWDHFLSCTWLRFTRKLFVSSFCPLFSFSTQSRYEWDDSSKRRSRSLHHHFRQFPRPTQPRLHVHFTLFTWWNVTSQC